MLSRAAFERYDRQVRNLAKGAEDYTRRMLGAFLGQNPEASVEECREFAMEVMAEAARVYGDAAATAAADYYDAAMEAAGNGAPRALLGNRVDAAQIERVARYQAGKLVKGDAAGFARECASYAADAAKRAANDTMLGNAERDGKRGVRFARVPSGTETCTFCQMLASRGFVYKSAKSAGEFSHFHRGCDCRIVASTDDEGLEGYDPDRELELWREFQEIEDGEGTRAEKKAKMRAVLEERPAGRIAGVKRGRPMSFPDADSGNVNPDYTGALDGFFYNCQTCVVAFEARRRGYNVKAKPKAAGSVSEELSYDTRLAWVDPKTGKKPMFAMGRGRDTPKKTLAAIKSIVETGGRYTLEFYWKAGGGHIVNLDLDTLGNIRIKDNQRGSGERSEWLGDLAVLEYLKDTRCDKYMHLLRVDDLEFNLDVVDEILTAR